MSVLKYIIACTLLLGLASCNDNFLDRYPETSLSTESYFKTVKDLELYTNTFYELIQPSYRENVSDNASIYAETMEVLDLLKGNITPATVEGWNSWSTLRRINFFLNRAHTVVGDPESIHHHMGIAKLMRAMWYYEMVKRYNDVPWFSTDLKDTDEELLYKSRDPRQVVVDSLVSDLAYAVVHIKPDVGNKTTISKWFAAAMMARICLHEGTFRKYHDELGLQSSADSFLEKAAASALTVMESGHFDIDYSGGFENAYRNLFISLDLSKSPEIILFKDYSNEANLKHSASAGVFDFVFSLSRSLMESYEAITDGVTVPYTSVPGYGTASFIDVFKNRDPRLAQTFMPPGYIKPGTNSPYRPNLNLGGYPQLKFVPNTADQVAFNSNYTDLPIVRLAEVMLIYAESKAELGSLTQNDLDRTINHIRNRVNMPAIRIDRVAHNPVLAAQYPNVNSPKADLIREIRRERRVELACEGFRYDDLMRWAAGHLLAEKQQGIYIDGLGLHDVTGDGIADVGIFKNQASNPVQQEERQKYIFFYLENSDGSPASIYLSGFDSGYIMDSGERDNPRNFLAPKYYYYPIPQNQLLLNPNLGQTNYW